MSQPFIYSVPLLTSQVRGAHPFYIGEGGQTENTENLWVDERQGLHRRPAIIKVGDDWMWGEWAGLFEYQYKSRGSAPSSQLVGYNIINTLAAGAHVLSEVNRVAESRILLKAVDTVYSGTAFTPGTSVELYWNSSTDSNGNSGGTAFVVADNVDFSTADGSLVLRDFDGSISAAQLATPGIRVQSSDANVRFLEGYQSPGQLTVASDDADQVYPNKIPTFAQFGRYLFIADNSLKAPVRFWSGGSSAGQFLHSAPRGSIVFTHQGRLWIAGLEGDGSTLVGSAINQPTNFNLNRGLPEDAIQLYIEQDDREAITGGASSYHGDLFVWKKSSLHRVMGDVRNPFGSEVTFRVQTVSRSVGCASHRTIVHVGNDIYWMSEHGVHSLSTTDKYGDIESTYLSFPIADVFEDINFSVIEKSQAVFLPRLSLYLLGVPRSGSQELNRLLAYSVVTKRWMTWDIGSFFAIALGPNRSKDSDTVYVSLDITGNAAFSKTQLSVLDFSGLSADSDQNAGVWSSGYTVDAITTKIEPGDLFANVENPIVRHSKKRINRLSVYLTPMGEDLTSTIYYSWDGGKEHSVDLDLNPLKDKPIILGDLQPNNALTSTKDTSVSSVPIHGTGRTFRFRIEDSNEGPLPYLHADLEVELVGTTYAQNPRSN